MEETDKTPDFLTAAEFLELGSQVSFGFATMPGGRRLRLRSLTETERAVEIDGWLGKTQLKVEGIDRDRFYRCRVLQMCAVDHEGNPMFVEADIPKIAGVQCGWVARACAEAMSLCGMNDDDVETEVKNLQPPTADSSN